MSDDIFAAIETGDLHRLSRLLREDADPNRPHLKLKYCPLHAAIFELDSGGPLEALDVLIDAGADVNRVDGRVDGAPPLLAALQDGQTAAARKLLARGADPKIVGRLGDSPLRLCAERDDVEMAALLLDRGAVGTINEAGGLSGMNALGHAVSNLSSPMVDLLVRSGADPSALDIDYQIARSHLPKRTVENAASYDRILEILTRASNVEKT